MSDFQKPGNPYPKGPINIPKMPPVDFEMPEMKVDPDKIRQYVDEAFAKLPPQAQDTVEKAKGLTQQQKTILLTVVGTYVLFKIEKRMVRKVVTKALREIPVRTDVPAFVQDLIALEKEAGIIL